MIKLCFLLFTLSCTTVLGQKFRSDYKYYKNVDGWLKYHSIPVVWDDARLRCQAEGGVLASPLNEDLGSVMLTIMKARDVSEIFTGIHSTYSKGSYASIEGIPLRDISGSKGEPNIDNKHNCENCLIMSLSGGLSDVRCEKSFRYFCYKKENAIMVAPNDCGTTDTEYNYSEVTGHCYKFHTYGQPWHLAHMICDAEGGYLAIINSESEAQVIRELYLKHPANSIVARVKDGAHVGFKADSGNNMWTTIHGQKLRDAGYANWDVNQPDNWTDNSVQPNGQNCGNVFRNGRLDDGFCLMNSPFICEKHPNTLQE